MKKAFAKYLFPLCIVLLGGFINLQANLQETPVTDNACYLQNVEGQHSSAVFNALQLGLEKRHCVEIDIEEQEEREEEATSHNFSSAYGSFLTAHFFAASWGQLFLESNTNRGFSIPKSASSIKKHVRFQVFRI
ncbi:hypothetical protein [Flagellimonas halotolerans]|uniref:Uncharacterized protein n=1 Tax=Flagellimonas halotolerans TaxID=3112164 RepID=A0ABU6IRR4_9FLAO|nr:MULTISPECIES: hypothetical protein [unclassified Allomuricauda]MEC3965857.1 hypothetical protein [Muricauda sp. SYSU M86414]MEC4265677.1 hypothetical protein [Muricauda sp. SYSU M84420]